MSGGRKQRAIGLILIAVALAGTAALLVPLPHQYRAAWRGQLLDLGHVPLFALLTVCLWWVLGGRIGRAAAAALVLAVASEAAQELVGRSATAADLVRSGIGVVLASLWLSLAEQNLPSRRVGLGVAVSLLLCVWPAVESYPVFADAWSAWQAFPVLADFRSRWQEKRWYSSTATIERVWNEPRQSWAGRVEFRPGETRSSGIVLFPIVADWREYRRLNCEFSFEGPPLTLLISVRDGQKVRPPRKRFDLVRRYSPGRHRLTIDLARLAEGRQSAPLDLSRVQSFHFDARGLLGRRTLVLERLYLE